jgi:hypothetical protein
VEAPPAEPDADTPPLPKVDVPPPEVWADTDDAIPSDDADAPESGADPVEPEDDGGNDDPPREPTAFPGPCRVQWTTGAVLRFEYGDGKGKVRIDEDGDGKAETCADFELAEGRTSRIRIDAGCNGKHETTIEPAYDDKLNVATAAVTEAEGAASEVTLVVLPGYVGLTPGYLLHAPRKAVKLTSRAGLVRTAKVASPTEGPPVSVTFTYTTEGRVRQIKEDLGADGSVDRQLDYRYDARGNVTRMTVTLFAGDASDKGTARLSYTCHDCGPRGGRLAAGLLQRDALGFGVLEQVQGVLGLHVGAARHRILEHPNHAAGHDPVVAVAAEHHQRPTDRGGADHPDAVPGAIQPAQGRADRREAEVRDAKTGIEHERVPPWYR